MKVTTRSEEKTLIKRRRKIINKHIMNEQQGRYVKRIEATVNNLRKVGGGMKETTFWEFRRKVAGKKEEQVTSMIDKDGKSVEGKTDILKVYEDFYKDLFKVKMAKTKEETDVEETIREQMKEIEIKAKAQITIRFKQDEIDRAIKVLNVAKLEILNTGKMKC
eukprot:Seg3022.2 transcript_id=Seg3022.2/GoldUCD/mRNA.D3Y31 product="hypothetical protein" protein_id=Seg3022.2/GoldUCD/D3Y31